MLLKHIPHELVAEILSWLPAKHLWPLRFVSKTWLRLITANPQFAKLHDDRLMLFNNRNPNPSILAWTRGRNPCLYLATDYTSCDKAIALEFCFTNDMYISGVSTGLLCLFCSKNKEVCILNPLTNDSITVSCLPIPSSRFPHYRNYTNVGFGFDHYSNKYKLIRFFCEYDCHSFKDYHYQVSVYTLGVDSAWRTIEEDLMDSRLSRPTVVVSGAMHWVTYEQYAVGAPRCEILAFDLKEEVFRKVPPPNCVDFDDTSVTNKIVELGGLLCMIERLKSADIEIWLMEEYGVVTSWSRKFRIGKLYTQIHDLYVLGIAHNGGIILNRDYKYLLLYDLETKSVVELTEFNMPSNAYVYVGSIISPRFITRVGTT